MMLQFLMKLPKAIAILIIRMYQALHGSFFMGVCRFHPTCSHYAVEAIETRGLGMGILLTAGRIARCQPFCKGGWDPVPLGPITAGPDRNTGRNSGRSYGLRIRVALAPHSPLGESLE